MAGSDQHGGQDSGQGGRQSGPGGRYEDAYQNPDTPWTVRPGAPVNPYGRQQPQPGSPFPPHAQDQGQGLPGQPDGPYGVPAQPEAAARYGQPSATGTPRTAEPDWAALADSRSRGRRRRKRSYTVAGVVVAVAVVGGITTLVLATGGTGKSKTAGTSPSPGTQSYTPPKPSFKPAPTVPPPPSADKVLSTASLDTDPFTAQALFTSDSITVGDRTYTVVARDTTTDCGSAADTALAAVLRNNQCVQLVRATVTGPSDSAATIALAQFATPAQAKAVVDGFAGGLKGMPGGAVKTLCPEGTGVNCLRQADSDGRYALLVVAGYGSGKSVTPPAPAIDAAGTDLNSALRQALTARGQQTSQEIDARDRQAALQSMNGTPAPSTAATR